MIEYHEDGITIVDLDRNEIIYWSQEEWEEDPMVVYSIANAIEIVTRHGVNALKARIAEFGLDHPLYS